MDEKPASGGVGFGTMALGAVLVGGIVLGLRLYQDRKAAPLPPPDPEPAAPKSGLAKPDQLPGGPPKKEVAPTAPGDSLSMVKTAKDYKGLDSPGLMVNALPEPPLTYQSDGGPDRPETRVVRRRSEWDAIWKGLGGHDMPVVDFEKYMGLVIFAGKRPAGTTVEVVSSKVEGGKIVVRWQAVPPEKPEPGAAHPVKAMLTPRLAQSPVFKEVK